jgi:hypothetical protein
LAGVSEVESKAKYTHLARSLKTYGITFFLVKVSQVLDFITGNQRYQAIHLCRNFQVTRKLDSLFLEMNNAITVYN